MMEADEDQMDELERNRGVNSGPVIKYLGSYNGGGWFVEVILLPSQQGLVLLPRLELMEGEVVSHHEADVCKNKVREGIYTCTFAVFFL